MIIDLQDDRRENKPWLPGDDRDVTNGLVVADSWGLPECVRHGAMNRVDQHRGVYRCSEMRRGVGAEVVPSSFEEWADRTGEMYARLQEAEPVTRGPGCENPQWEHGI